MSDDDQAIIPSPSLSLASPPVTASTPLDQNPAAIYLASLGEGSRRTMRTALNISAGLLGTPEHRNEVGLDIHCLDAPGANLRYLHTVAIRAQLQNRYAPATANKLLAALRRVLKEARRLGQISADDHERATDLATIRAERLPRGRLVSDKVEASCLADWLARRWRRSAPTGPPRPGIPPFR